VTIHSAPIVFNVKLKPATGTGDPDLNFAGMGMFDNIVQSFFKDGQSMPAEFNRQRTRGQVAVPFEGVANFPQRDPRNQIHAFNQLIDAVEFRLHQPDDIAKDFSGLGGNGTNERGIGPGWLFFHQLGEQRNGTDVGIDLIMQIASDPQAQLLQRANASDAHRITKNTAGPREPPYRRSHSRYHHYCTLQHANGNFPAG